MRFVVALSLLIGPALALPAVAAPGKPAARPAKPAKPGAVPRPDLPSRLPLSRPAVVVNGEVIPISVYVDRLSLAYGPQLREDLVLEALLRQEAKRRKITASKAEIEAMVDRVYSQYVQSHGDERRMITELDRTRGWSVEIFRQVVREQAPVQVLRLKLHESLAKPADISDAEIQGRYKQREAAFHQPEAIRISHIFYAKSPEGSAEKDAAAAQKADAMLKRVLEAKGGNFEALARQNSEDETTRALGGRIATPIVRGANPFGVAFERIVFQAAVGVVDQVVVSSMGYHIIRIDGKQPERQVPLEEVRTQIRDSLLAEKRDKAMDELMLKLRGAAKVNTGKF